jgi:hypothetical protein
MIANYAQRQPRSWDKEIQKLAFSIGTAINETTGVTPAFMMFGRDIREPLDLIADDQIKGPPPTIMKQEILEQCTKGLINNLTDA